MILYIFHHEVQLKCFDVSEELTNLYVVSDFSQALENGLTF
jgi:hypothetical protein